MGHKDNTALDDVVDVLLSDRETRERIRGRLDATKPDPSLIVDIHFRNERSKELLRQAFITELRRLGSVKAFADYYDRHRTHINRELNDLGITQKDYKPQKVYR